MGEKYDMATGYCRVCYQIKRAKEKIETITTQEEARKYAIDWQNWQSNQSMSYGELAQWNDIFQKLGEKFDLTNEFKENAII